MPWLAEIAAHLDAREDAAHVLGTAPVLTRPCSCCADPACKCVTAWCRDTLACTRCCRCARCRAAWRNSTAHPVDHARRRIEAGALWYTPPLAAGHASSATLTHAPGTDGTSRQASTASPGPESEETEAHSAP